MAQRVVIDVKGADDKYAISSAVSFFKELGYTRFRCRTDPETSDQNTRGYCHQMLGGRSSRRASFARGDDSRESRESGVLWKDGMVFCRDKFELCDWTLRRDLGQLLTLSISVYRGL